MSGDCVGLLQRNWHALAAQMRWSTDFCTVKFAQSSPSPSSISDDVMASAFSVGDLAQPALLAISAILIFILILALTSGKKKGPSRAVIALGEPEITDSTVFIQEGDHIVRRSTRRVEWHICRCCWRWSPCLTRNQNSAHAQGAQARHAGQGRRGAPSTLVRLMSRARRSSLHSLLRSPAAASSHAPSKRPPRLRARHQRRHQPKLRRGWCRSRRRRPHRPPRAPRPEARGRRGHEAHVSQRSFAWQVQRHPRLFAPCCLSWLCSRDIK